MGLTSAQYDEIIRSYDRERIQNEHIHEERMNDVYIKIPEYSHLEDEIRINAMDCGKRALLGDKNALFEMREKSAEIEGRMKQLLLDNGFPADYVDPVYTCKSCRDTGYADGKKCRCLNQKILKILYSQSNIESILEKENFDTLSYDYYNDSERVIMTEIIDRCKGFVNNFDNEYKNLLFTGSPGVGKTFLTNCIAKALLDSEHSVIYFTSLQLFDTLSRYEFERNSVEDTGRMREDIFTCELLVIDDLGTEIPNTFIDSQLFLVVNERDLRRKSTIISTNLELSELSKRYTERVASRLWGNYELIKPEIRDIRFEKKKLY